MAGKLRPFLPLFQDGVFFWCFQQPDGILFPDIARLYVTAIEDRSYKDEKINCKLKPLFINRFTLSSFIVLNRKLLSW